MAASFHTYQSPRNIPLVYNNVPGTIGTITVENYLKWYDLFIVQPDGSVTKVEPGPIEWRGHVPTPASIMAYADKANLDVDHQAMEMIVGRYILEVIGNEPEYIGAPTRSLLTTAV
jgi:hypothetical protein